MQVFSSKLRTMQRDQQSDIEVVPILEGDIAVVAADPCHLMHITFGDDTLLLMDVHSVSVYYMYVCLHACVSVNEC